VRDRALSCGWSAHTRQITLLMRVGARFRCAPHGHTPILGSATNEWCSDLTLVCTPSPDASASQLEGDANVTLIDSNVRGNRAQTGGAVHVSGGSMLRIEYSSIVDNAASVSGGAIQVRGASPLLSLEQPLTSLPSCSCPNCAWLNLRMQVELGRVELLNMTLLDQNTAPNGHGSSIYLASSGSLRYTLPTLPARYLFIRQGDTFELRPGAEDASFPYACPAGVVGGSLPEEQSGPACSRPW
jgi:hypothetical protein